MYPCDVALLKVGELYPDVGALNCDWQAGGFFETNVINEVMKIKDRGSKVCD